MDEQQKPKRNFKDSFSDLGKRAGNSAASGFRRGLRLVSKTILFLVFNPVTVGVVMFVIGARMHEVGYLAGVMGKDLKGATVTLSGSCKVQGIPRLPALAEDQVKITYVDGEKLQAVVRQTRELVECRLADVAIDKLPLLANIFKSPMPVPELTVAEVKKVDPEWKKLAQKTLVMSGSCVDLDGKTLPAFTDERVDVTSVEAVEGSPETFTLSGIKKSDRQALRCLSSSIKYEEYRPVAQNPLLPSTPSEQSFVNQIIKVTGSCVPDKRTQINKTKKFALYKLANTPVQVLQEEVRNGKLVRLVGTIMDKTANVTVGTQVLSIFGEQIVCEQATLPFIYSETDEDTNFQEGKIETETNAETPAQAPSK